MNTVNATAHDDDRITCAECNHLAPTGVCRAASVPHGPVIALRGYTPARDLPRRCHAYQGRRYPQGVPAAWKTIPASGRPLPKKDGKTC